MTVSDNQSITTRMRSDVEFLASDECAGRAPGTPGGLLAREFVETRMTDLGLKPQGVSGFRQPIPPIGGANLIGTIPGRGPLADRYIILGAHYDHLGVFGGEIYRGADDNGSGVAVLLETARRLADDRSGLRRSVLMCAFDAEEPPNFLESTMGSIVFASDPTVPLEAVDQMICLDIVGRRLGGPATPDEVGDSVFLLGGERSGAGDVVNNHLRSDRVALRRADADLVPPLSDHFAFEAAHIPFLFLTCGRSAEYHTPDDTPDRLDYPKMGALAGTLTNLIVDLSVADDIGSYRAGARNDRVTLDSMTSLLEPLSALNPDTDIALDMVTQAYELLEDDRLPDYAHADLSSLLMMMEEALAYD